MYSTLKKEAVYYSEISMYLLGATQHHVPEYCIFYIFVYFNLYGFRLQTGKQEILIRMEASVPRI
jgi:hypothetical protein